jgi:hypothetical protein
MPEPIPVPALGALGKIMTVAVLTSLSYSTGQWLYDLVD